MLYALALIACIGGQNPRCDLFIIDHELTLEDCQRTKRQIGDPRLRCMPDTENEAQEELVKR